MLTVVPDVAGARPAEGQPSSLIDQIVRDSARQMLAAALQAEVAAYIGQFAGLRDEVYLWVDGIHLGIRLAEGKLAGRPEGEAAEEAQPEAA